MVDWIGSLSLTMRVYRHTRDDSWSETGKKSGCKRVSSPTITLFTILNTDKSTLHTLHTHTQVQASPTPTETCLYERSHREPCTACMYVRTYYVTLYMF